MPRKKAQAVSPFLKGLNTLTLEIRQKGSQSEGEESIDGHILRERTIKDVLVDPQVYAKVYHDLDGIDLILSLSRPAKDLYILIPHLLKKNQDFIVCSNEYLQKKLKLTKNSVSQAVTELCDIALLARKAQSEYWINPYMIFKGDRVKHFKRNAPEAIRIKTTTQLEIDFNKITHTKFTSSL